MPGGAGAIGLAETAFVAVAGAALASAVLLSLLPVVMPTRRMGESLRSSGTSAVLRFLR